MTVLFAGAAAVFRVSRDLTASGVSWSASSHLDHLGLYSLTLILVKVLVKCPFLVFLKKKKHFK